MSLVQSHLDSGGDISGPPQTNSPVSGLCTAVNREAVALHVHKILTIIFSESGMENQETHDLHRLGWENDPAEERFRLSTIDLTPNCAYNHYVLFFRLRHERTGEVVDVLKKGLERTLSQARHLCGTIERDPNGGYSFVKKRTSTVKYVVKCTSSPSLGELESAHFACKSLGDLAFWSANPWMTWGEGKPEADPDRGAVVSAYQVTFVPGGMVFSMHSHHYASDVMGWHNFTRQLAENCYAVCKETSYPPWDPACLDVSRFTLEIPAADQVDGPPAASPQASRHPAQQALLFHLPRSKAACLKELASPADKSLRISTYDAMCAFVWRQLSKIREPFYNPEPTTQPFFGEAVNMRPRLHNPELPERMLRIVLCGAFGNTAPAPQPTVKELIAPEHEYPLSELALYIRKLTNSCDEKHMGALLKAIAPIRDKRSISLNLNALPPMSIWVTDHRPADVSDSDFGFGKPITHRHLWGEHLSPGLLLIYAPIKSSSNPDEGFIFTITMEKELVPNLLQDPEWTSYFEYLGED